MVRELQVRGGEAIRSHSRDVQIESWLLFVVALVVVAGHCVVKWVRARRAIVQRRIGWDDVALVIALVLALGQTIAVSVQADGALGRHLATLNAGQVKTFQAAQYAAFMLWILSIGTTRVSIWLFIWQTVHEQRQKRVSMGLVVLCLLWTITSFLAAAFPCGLPNPWQYLGNKCYDRIAFARYLAASNIVLELGSISLPTALLWNRGRRTWTALAFASHFFLIAALIPQLYYTKTLSSASNIDFTFKTWSLTACTQLVQSLALITAALPSSLPHFFPARPTPRIRHVQWDHTHPDESTSTTFPPPPYPTRPPLAQMRTNHGYVAPLATYHFTGSPGPQMQKHKPSISRSLSLSWSRKNSSTRKNSSSSEKYSSSENSKASSSDDDDEQWKNSADFEDVFQRRWDVPWVNIPPAPSPPPTSVSQIGVLPVCEASDSEEEREGAQGPALQRCRGERGMRMSGISYVFERDKVISLPPITTPTWEGKEHEGFDFS